ncbi:MAG TPA: SusC/RagA family TonB-linked outer membrane protein [Gemmatimonadaceae bacterium]|jgi:TonB-linked SusC/RagA family outer membrane protein
MKRHFLRRLVALGTLLGSLPAVALAQQGTTISGRVISDTQQPLQGVSVSIATLGAGGYTDALGHYSFTVAASRTGQTATVTARRIGFEPKTATVTLSGGAITQDFALNAAAASLSEVVVTALGQTAERSQLGSAQQTVNTEQLNTTFAPNVESQLQGKVSGVSIVGNGTQGGSTSINIRGYTSITGNNQPLFVVDGIPVSNADRGSQQQGGGLTGSKDFGNTIQDLNSEDIESITVLKGPNAGALYGSRAANGVILITTKKGRSAASNVEFSSSLTWDKVATLPDFQNSYGQGSGGDFAWVNGLGADGNDQSYGPRLNGQAIDQFTGKAQPWVAHPDNVSSFFNTGQTRDATISVSGGTDHSSARLSVSGENTDGVIPNNFLRRLGGVASGSMQVGDKLSLNGSVDYTRNDGLNRPGQGYVGSIMEGLFVWFGRQVDMNALKNWQQPSTTNNGPPGREYNWNYSYHNNPYFMQFDNPESDQRDRVIASGSAAYKFADWLTGMVRTGTDTYRTNINADYAGGNIELNNTAGTPPVSPAYNGAFSLIGDTYTENNTDALLTASHSAGSHFQLNATAGANRRYSAATTTQVQVTGITVAGIYNVANAAITPVNSNSQTNLAVNSGYGSASFTYNNWWTVEGTARNDWSSTLPQGHNSYFYPSVNTSVVLTDAIPSLKGNTLSYLKLRGGVARVGNDAPAYDLYTTYSGNSSKFGNNSLFTLGNSLLNPDLLPETTVSNEGGFELGLWNGRVSLDASLYDKYTKNEITPVNVAPSSGYSSKLINGGEIDNRGYEALLTVEPIHNSTVDWSSTFNFSHNRAMVTSLSAPNIFGGFQNSIQVEAKQGDPYGAFYGYGIKTDPASGLPLTSGGTYQATDTLQYLGSIQPNWTGGWLNTVRVGRFTLSSTLDIRRGGKLFSGTNFYGQATGTLATTMYGREVDWDNPGIVINGIDEASGKPNTTNVSSETYFQSLSYNDISSVYVYDDNYVKLREVRLGYDLAPRFAAKLNANAVNIALISRNLWMSTDVPNVDPEISYNTGSNQGIEFAELPAPRSFGFAVRVTP